MQKAPKKDRARCLRISELGGASYAERRRKSRMMASPQPTKANQRAGWETRVMNLLGGGAGAAATGLVACGCSGTGVAATSVGGGATCSRTATGFGSATGICG